MTRETSTEAKHRHPTRGSSGSQQHKQATNEARLCAGGVGQTSTMFFNCEVRARDQRASTHAISQANTQTDKPSQANLVKQNQTKPYHTEPNEQRTNEQTHTNKKKQASDKIKRTSKQCQTNANPTDRANERTCKKRNQQIDATEDKTDQGSPNKEDTTV